MFIISKRWSSNIKMIIHCFCCEKSQMMNEFNYRAKYFVRVQ